MTIPSDRNSSTWIALSALLLGIIAIIGIGILLILTAWGILSPYVYSLMKRADEYTAGKELEFVLIVAALLILRGVLKKRK